MGFPSGVRQRMGRLSWMEASPKQRGDRVIELMSIWFLRDDARWGGWAREVCAIYISNILTNHERHVYIYMCVMAGIFTDFDLCWA